MHRKSKWGNTDLGLSAAMKFIATRSTRFTYLHAECTGKAGQELAELVINDAHSNNKMHQIHKSKYRSSQHSQSSL
jgi:hypothetical protein